MQPQPETGLQPENQRHQWQHQQAPGQQTGEAVAQGMARGAPAQDGFQGRDRPAETGQGMPATRLAQQAVEHDPEGCGQRQQGEPVHYWTGGRGANRALRSASENLTPPPLSSDRMPAARAAFCSCMARIFSSILPATTSL